MRDIKNLPFCWQEKKALSLIRDNFKKSQLPLAISLYTTLTEQASYFWKDTFNIFWIKLIEQSWIWYKSFREIMNKFIDLKIISFKKWELYKIPLTQEFIYWESEIMILQIWLVQTCTEPCTISCTEPCTLSGQSNKENKEELKEKPKEEIIIYKQEKTFLDLFKQLLENLDFIEKLKIKYNIENEDIEKSAEKFLIYRTEKNPNWKKEKWQMQKTFDIQKRFYTWLWNNNNWNKKNNNLIYKI